MKIQQIVKRAKAIRKLRPKTEWKNAMKQAATQLRNGHALSGTAAPAVGSVKRKPARKRKATAKPVRRKRARVGSVKRAGSVARRSPRSVGKLDNTAVMIGVAGLAVVGFLLLRNNNNSNTTYPPGYGGQLPPLYQSSNTLRNQQASEIVSWATAAGIALAGVAKLIESLNQKSDAEVSTIYNTAQQTGNLDLGYWV